MYILTTTEDKSSFIGNKKYVYLCFCEDDDNINNEYCEFEIIIFNKGQDVYLVENG